MGTLTNAILTTPIIDHHAHNLLLPNIADHSSLSITTEACGEALQYCPSSLSHIRAVKQLADILDCEPTWDVVESRLETERTRPHHAWARRCFQGIECVLIDDGLDEKTVHPYQWHNRLTHSHCKRIVRIEKVAEETVRLALQEYKTRPSPGYDLLTGIRFRFKHAIQVALRDPNVAGFKSVICYRTGLAIPPYRDIDLQEGTRSLLKFENPASFTRLEDENLGPWFVHLTAQVLADSSDDSPYRKPFQFHTGLGDNDLSLRLASPSHLQYFIKHYPEVQIVLLHASYPFTQEAAYFASTYANVFMDIGEVFPMVSQDGQEKVIREALELCPSEKLMWSTDGHRFPETYLLAVIQVREAMEQVLQAYVRHKSLTASQAIKIVKDVFFNTSNSLYNLNLSILASSVSPTSESSLLRNFRKNIESTDFEILTVFLRKNPSVKYFRCQWLDYTSTLRVRVLTVKHALELTGAGKSVSVLSGIMGLLQNDSMAPGFTAIGLRNLCPRFDSLRLGQRGGYAMLQCELQEVNGEDAEDCPRTLLRNVVKRAKREGVEFLVGHEIEVVFMKSTIRDGRIIYGHGPISEGHAWSTSRALVGGDILSAVESIAETLERCGIDLQQFHAESAPGQYEFVTGPLPPLEAADSLLATREIISATAMKYSLRATIIPKPYTNHCGSGCHNHISVVPAEKHVSFYAGILKHLPAIIAFTYPNISSYERVQDSVWCGGKWVAWGTYNRETPLRKIEGAHWEIKCVDGMANPYLALGAILGAGLQGVQDGDSMLIKDCTVDPATLKKSQRKDLGINVSLPTTITEALKNLKDDATLRGIVGQKVVDTYLAVKKAENEMLVKMEPEERRQWLIERY